MDRLPDELLLLVLSQIQSNAIHALTLTSRKLNSLATPLLYSRYDIPLPVDRYLVLAVTLTRRPNYRSLIEKLSLASVPEAPKGVRQLTQDDLEILRSTDAWKRLDGMYKLDDFQSDRCGQRLGDSSGEHACILHLTQLCAVPFVLCPNLRELRISTEWLNLISECVREVDALVKLETLHVHWDDFPASQKPFIGDTLGVFPSLREMSFTGCEPFFWSLGKSWKLPAVRTLALCQCDMMVGDLVRLLQGVHELESLTYEWYSTEYAEELMIAHGTLHLLAEQRSTLRKLTMTMSRVAKLEVKQNPSYFHDFAQAVDLAAFERLEELEIEYLAFLDDGNMNWGEVHLPERLTAPLSAILPPNLQRLTLRHCLGRVRQHLHGLIHPTKHAAILNQCLQSIHVEMWPEYSEESWSALKKEFTVCGVDLIVSPRKRLSFQREMDWSLEQCPYEDAYMTEAEWGM